MKVNELLNTKPEPIEDYGVDFDLDEMKAAINSGFDAMPVGIKGKELHEWLLKVGNAS